MKDVKGVSIVGTVMEVGVGIAMLQGARYEHAEALISAGNELGVKINVLELRTSSDIDSTINEDVLDALILPGGESTTMRIASDSHGLLNRIYQLLSEKSDFPVLGTCAGAILLSKPPDMFEPFIKAEIDRNSYGRQKDSFQAKLRINGFPIPEIKFVNNTSNKFTNEKYHPLPISANSETKTDNSDEFPGVFIRAPKYLSVEGSTPVVFHEEEIVGVKNNNMLALTFHPELTTDRSFHRWLIDCAISRGESK